MKAKNIYHLSSEPAPKEWTEIPEIKEKRPSPIGQEVSLQRLDGTNICIWYTRKAVYWNPVGDPFIVTEKQRKGSMSKIICLLGMWIFADAYFSLYTYWGKEGRKPQHIRVIRLIIGIILMVVG